MYCRIIAYQDGFTAKSLYCSFGPTCRPIALFQLPFFDTIDVALDSWKHNQRADTEISLTVAIGGSRNQGHHALANLNRAESSYERVCDIGTTS
jgi:hypothetical protein